MGNESRINRRDTPGRVHHLAGLFGLERRENPTQTVPRWDAIGQLKKLPQPVCLGFGPTHDCRGTFATDDHATDGDHNHVDQKMATVARMPRIGQRLEMSDSKCLTTESNETVEPAIGHPPCTHNHARHTMRRELEDSITEWNGSRQPAWFAYLCALALIVRADRHRRFQVVSDL